MSLKFNKTVKLTMLILLSLVMFVGCSSDDKTEYNYHYTGENENWSAEYIGKTVLDFYTENGVLKCNTTADGNLVFTYKGELTELSSVREIGYEFVNNGGTSTFEQAPDTKTFSWSIGINGQVEESKNLKIIISGKTENIEMKNTK